MDRDGEAEMETDREGRRQSNRVRDKQTFIDGIWKDSEKVE